jgi:hypothetical protein
VAFAGLPGLAAASETPTTPSSSTSSTAPAKAPTTKVSATKASTTTAKKPATRVVAKMSRHAAKTAPKPDVIIDAPADMPVVLTAGQLAEAGRVIVGHVDCEMGQKVDLEADETENGHFKLTFHNVTYHMVPEETTTGAVRLEDHRNGLVWLQIPVKSMLMNDKLGQRMVDACQYPQQRAFAEALLDANKVNRATPTTSAAAPPQSSVPTAAPAPVEAAATTTPPATTDTAMATPPAGAVRSAPVAITETVPNTGAKPPAIK